MKRKKSFLQSVCPFTILESRVTWGEFIATYIKVDCMLIVPLVYTSLRLLPLNW